MRQEFRDIRLKAAKTNKNYLYVYCLLLKHSKFKLPENTQQNKNKNVRDAQAEKKTRKTNAKTSKTSEKDK